MYRIDNPSAVVNLQAPPLPGTPGYFTGGNPAAGLEATRVDAWWLNQMQEEVLTVIGHAGITPNKADHTQLWQALNMLFTGSGTVGMYLPLVGGTLAGPGNLTVGGSLTANKNIELNDPATAAWITRPNISGQRNINLGVTGGSALLEQVNVYSSLTDFSGQVNANAISTTGYSLPVDATNYVWSGSLVASNALMINVYFNSTLGFRHAQNETGAVIGASPNPVDPARAGITFGWTAAGAQGTAAPTSELMFLGSTQSRMNCQQLVLQANLDVANDALAQSLCPHFNNTGFVGTGGLGWAIMNSYNFNNLSDISTKRDIRLSATGALDHVKAVPVSEFHWLNEDDDAPLHRGFVAQDVRRVMGDDFAGCCEQNGVLGWSLNEMLAVLWQGVQELAAKVDALEARGG